MNHASEIAQDVAGRKGWTETILLSVVLDYIENQGDNDAFAEYLDEA